MGKSVGEAQARGLTVSLDVNYRRKLWLPEHAAETLAPLIPQANLLFCTQADACDVLGFSRKPDGIAQSLRKAGARTVVVTAGAEGVFALHGEESYHVPAIPLTEVDRVGAGDAFSAGVIDGFLDRDIERGLRFGVAMAALKHTIPGDELIATREEIEAVASGASTEIRR